MPKDKESTFEFQDQLPPLPVPSLEASCERYLASLEPLQSHKEHLDTKRAVKDFLVHQGPELQAKLEQYAKGKSNYIEQFWYDSYLNFDNPVVLNLNPFFLLEDDPTPARTHQVDRAASLVISSLSFVRAVRREELPPDKLRNTPLDMYQYSRLFGTARIPTENGCHIAQDPESKHIVVLCHGQFYWFDVLDDKSDLIMTEKDLAINLASIINDASEVPINDAARSALGILSTENRKTWSGLRDLLYQDEPNSDCLSIVDSALFVLCLDYTEPETTNQLCMNMLCGTSQIERGVQVGTCMNRWYDKLQIIVCKNGSAGINFEHTGVDGHTVLRFTSDVYTDTILRFAKSINGGAPSLWATTSPDPAKRDPSSFGDVHTTPHKLEWNLTPSLLTALRFAETRLADLIGQNEFATLEYSTYGKTFITSHGFSPDAYVQMAFQAAYFGLYGRSESVYEPAMTKTFYHGRTEAIRSVTMKSAEFVKTFWGDNPADAKIKSLREACEEHTRITKEAAKGQGHDRHLYALWCIWQRSLDEAYSRPEQSTPSSNSSEVSPRSASPPAIQPSSTHHRASSNSDSSGTVTIHPSVPSLFADPGYEKLSSTILSTSNCGNPSLRLFGFGPTSANGFGLGYIIKDSSISICASSKHRQTQRFADALEAYFGEMRRLLRNVQGMGVKASPALSKVREKESERERRVSVKGRVMSRGRSVLDSQGKTVGGSQSMGDSGVLEQEDEDDEYGLGGCMLLSSMKSKKEDEDRDDKAMQRRNIGRMLRIAEY